MDRLGYVTPDLLGVNIEGGGNLHIADMITAEIDVHQPRNRFVRPRVGIIGKALNK
jgi:hypothetical protein